VRKCLDRIKVQYTMYTLREQKNNRKEEQPKKQ